MQAEKFNLCFPNPALPESIADKLANVAGLLEVEVTDLVGDYNRFLYDGQGWQVKMLRTATGLPQSTSR